MAASCQTVRDDRRPPPGTERTRSLSRLREPEVDPRGRRIGPARRDDLRPGVEVDSLGTVDVAVAEQRGLPTAEGVVRHRDGDGDGGLAEIVEDGRAPDDAVVAPRLHHQVYPDLLQVEPRFDRASLPPGAAPRVEKPMFPIGRVQLVALGHERELAGRRGGILGASTC